MGVDLDGTSQTQSVSRRLSVSLSLSVSLCLSHLRPFAHSPGVNFTTTVADPKVDLDTIKRVLAEYRVHNADVHMRGDYDVDDIVDVIEGRCVYIPCIYAINKSDPFKLVRYRGVRCVEDIRIIFCRILYGITSLRKRLLVLICDRLHLSSNGIARHINDHGGIDLDKKRFDDSRF